jgi:hypothetical protein
MCELREGEQLVWVGRPIPKRRVSAEVPFAVLGGLLAAWAGYGTYVLAVRGRWAAVVSGAFALLGIVFVTFPFSAASEAKATVYAVTTQRCIAIEPSADGMRTTSYEPGALSVLHRTEGTDGSGDLVFAENIVVSAKGSTSTQPKGFLGIEDVRTVEKLVRALIDASGRT